MTLAEPALRIAGPDAIDPAALRGLDRTAKVLDIGGETMGTTWRALIAVPGYSAPDTQLLTALVQARLDRIVAQMSHWDAESHLCRFNRAQAGRVTVLPADFAKVLSCALEIAAASGGVFDPAQGRLTDIWGLGSRKMASPPDQDLIEEAMHHSGWRKLVYDAQGRALRQPGGLWLDLSGIAKGFAADAVADMLAERGTVHALVEVGGEFCGQGMRPDGDPWWVEAEVPPKSKLAGLRVALHQLGMATSGDYLRGAHTLDPRTGYPAIHATTAVTVIHRSCMKADAWATALSVLPSADARRLAIQQGLSARIISRDGSEWLSPALAAML